METTLNKLKSVATTTVSKDSDGFLQRVNKPNASKEDVAELREMLKQTPEMASFAGDLADRTKSKLLEQISSVPLVVESTKVYIEQMKDELGWQGSSMLERLLIEAIINCWLHYHNASVQFAVVTGRSHSITEGKYLDERVNLAHKRFLRSIESLAKTRKLLKSTPVSMEVDYDSITFSSNKNTVME